MLAFLFKSLVLSLWAVLVLHRFQKAFEPCVVLHELVPSSAASSHGAEARAAPGLPQHGKPQPTQRPPTSATTTAPGTTLAASTAVALPLASSTGPPAADHGGEGGPRIAVMVIGFDIADGESKPVLWTTFKHLLGNLLANSWQPDLYFCARAGTNLSTLEGVVDPAVLREYATTVPVEFLDTSRATNQFQRMKWCYIKTKEAAFRRGLTYEFYLRSRPDMVFAEVSLPRTLSTACVHTRLRWVGNLQDVNCQVVSGDLACDYYKERTDPCATIDDQFAIVPAKLAEIVFDWAGLQKGEETVYHYVPGLCTKRTVPENRFGSWILSHKMRICPIGHPSSGSSIHMHLMRVDKMARLRGEEPSAHSKEMEAHMALPVPCDPHSVKDCAHHPNQLPYEQWMDTILGLSESPQQPSGHDRSTVPVGAQVAAPSSSSVAPLFSTSSPPPPAAGSDAMPRPPEASPTGGARIAVMVIGAEINDAESTPVLWTTFKHLVASLLASSWHPDLYFCARAGTNMSTLESVVDGAVLRESAGRVPIEFLDTSLATNQFQCMKWCFIRTKESASRRGIEGYQFYIRSRPDLVFADVSLPLTLSTDCLHIRLRWVGNLKDLNCQMVTGNACNIYRKYKEPCATVDDQFAIVPARLAEIVFDWPGLSKGEDTVYNWVPGLCTEKTVAENRFGSWILSHKMRICPIGHPSSGSSINVHLMKGARKRGAEPSKHSLELEAKMAVPVNCDPKAVKECARHPNPVPYEEWMSGLLNMTESPLQHEKKGHSLEQR
mmetsp:Transcript_143819/g.459558  ORF Transcript_143819/g.459558 Transcript_143819/m.459558 type:complete len:777 (-) Transcript_143819:890-3220(-)